MIRSGSGLFQGDVQIDDFFSQCVTVKPEKGSGLYLIAPGLTQCRSDEGAFHG